jgi:hypothetical protein
MTEEISPAGATRAAWFRVREQSFDAGGDGAVFLSYASQDVDAARRICEALRSGGLEVWFDQSELRGGDAWDQKIRRQIRECALFVPVISANTQSRLEGYFRREWRLAVERMYDMAAEKAFLVPVVIDATGDRTATVPEEFRAVQGTRLPDGDTPGAFADRVKGLLSGSNAAPMPASRNPTLDSSPAKHARLITRETRSTHRPRNSARPRGHPGAGRSGW